MEQLKAFRQLSEYQGKENSASRDQWFKNINDSSICQVIFIYTTSQQRKKLHPLAAVSAFQQVLTKN